MTISGKRISNPNGACINIRDSSNVTITDSVIGPCKGMAIRTNRVNGLEVSRNTIKDSHKGVYALNSSGIRVARNDFRGTFRNLVQFDKVSGGGNNIVRNHADIDRGNGVSEDLINLYRSNGQSGDPIKVQHNRFRGGGSSRSGSGIMLGDNGGSHQMAVGNTLVEPGQVGIGVASGTNIRVSGNRVTSGAVSWSNVALYVWKVKKNTACGNVRVDGNAVSWKKKTGRNNPWWGGGGCGSVQVDGNDFNAGLSDGIFDD